MANDPTIQRLRDDADRFDAEGDDARASGDEARAFELYAQALLARRLIARLEHTETSGQTPARSSVALPEGGDQGTLGTMDTATHSRSRGAAVSAAMVNHSSKVLIWEVLREHGMSLPELVEQENALILAGKLRGFHELNEGTARSWTKESASGRQIPRQWANRWAKRFRRPALATNAAWPKGIRD